MGSYIRLPITSGKYILPKLEVLTEYTERGEDLVVTTCCQSYFITLTPDDL